MIKQVYREANKPEPTELIDKNGWVKWGEDNLYPQFLNRLYYENPVHGGVINQKVKFITSGGIDLEAGDPAVLKSYEGAFSLQEVIEKMALTYEIGDMYVLYFKKNRRTKLWQVDVLDYELIRVSESGMYYHYSEDWSKSKQGQDEGYRKIKNIQYVTLEDTECVMCVKTPPLQRSFYTEGKTSSKDLTSNFYPTVGYAGAITDIMASIEMSFFTYSEVVNGWKGGTLINLSNGLPEDEQTKKKLLKDIKGEASARDKQGGLTVTFSDGKERAAEVHQINGNDLDKRYDQAKKTCRDNILMAHGVISPTLFGVLSDGIFGSKEEMETAYLLFVDNYVRFRQRQLLEPLTWALKKLNGFTGVLKFNEYTPLILQPKEQPVQEDVELEKDTHKKDKELEEKMLSLFRVTGRQREKCRLVQSKVYDGKTDNEAEVIEKYKSSFIDDLTEQQRNILKMINDGESYPAITDALKIGGIELSNELVELGAKGYLDGWELTESAAEQVDEEIKIEILYSYEKRPDAPDLVPGGESRDFCRELVELSKTTLYTREDINRISAEVGRDVWSYRGGWYHNPKTGVNTPSCRHTWMQNVNLG